jgi:hypothetical protein
LHPTASSTSSSSTFPNILPRRNLPQDTELYNSDSNYCPPVTQPSHDSVNNFGLTYTLSSSAVEVVSRSFISTFEDGIVTPSADPWSSANFDSRTQESSQNSILEERINLEPVITTTLDANVGDACCVEVHSQDYFCLSGIHVMTPALSTVAPESVQPTRFVSLSTNAPLCILIISCFNSWINSRLQCSLMPSISRASYHLHSRQAQLLHFVTNCSTTIFCIRMSNFPFDPGTSSLLN